MSEWRQRKRLQGRVVSDKMQKTVVVEVSRRVLHPRYQKFITRKKNYKAHDEHDQYHVGDLVVIEECRPLSRHKRWRVIRRIDHGVAANPSGGA